MPELAVTALLNVLNELIDGSSPEAAWLFNQDDRGLLAALSKLSAAAASAVPPSGGASIAAHVDHLRYGLELLNRWAQGEEPFADANYSASWSRTTVSEADWAQRQDDLRREAYAWREALKQPRNLGDFEQTAIVASIAHIAYHLGAIRQIDRAARGPSAND
jgi:hypothetical protein